MVAFTKAMVVIVDIESEANGAPGLKEATNDQSSAVGSKTDASDL